jgi:hypothetical protein
MIAQLRRAHKRRYCEEYQISYCLAQQPGIKFFSGPVADVFLYLLEEEEEM